MLRKYRFLLYMICSLTAFYLIISFADILGYNSFSYTRIQLFGLVCIFGMFFTVIHIWKKKGLIITGLSAAVFWAVVFLFDLEPPVFEYLDNTTKHPTVFTAFLICAGCWILVLLMANKFWFRSLFAIGLMVLLIVCLFADMAISHEAVVLSLIYIFLIIIEWIQYLNRRQSQPERQKLLLYLLPFVLVFFIVYSSIPAKTEPYPWNGVKRVWYELRDFADNMLYELEIMFNFNIPSDSMFARFTGFAEDADIDTGASPNIVKVMDILEPKYLVTNTYLIGSVYDTFDGQVWRSSETDTAMPYNLDYVQTLQAVLQYDAPNISDYLKKGEFYVEYERFHTKTLFYPLKSQEVLLTEKSGRRNNSYYADNGNLRFDRYAARDMRYKIEYWQLNLDSPKFYEMLIAVSENSKQFSQIEDSQIEEYHDILTNSDYVVDGVQYEYSQVEEYYDILTNSTYVADNIKYDELQELFRVNKEQIYEIYTEKPELSERTEAYVREITANYDNGIDKLKAIETVLKQYEYTLTPDAIPDDRDFLEYFLLDSRAGYCTHFATAFTLLARYEGFPARYVQGYTALAPDSTADNAVEVLNDRAHAWAEVYIDGVGWIPFEATPSYGDVRYTPWSTSSGSGDGVAEIPEHYLPSNFVDPNIDEFFGTAGGRQSTWELNVFDLIVAIIVLVVLIICVIIITIAGSNLLGRHKYAKLNINEKILYDIGRILALLRTIGYPLQEGETLDELTNRVNGKEGVILVPDEGLRIMGQVRYGNQEADETQQAIVENIKNDLIVVKKQYKQNNNIFFRLFKNKKIN